MTESILLTVKKMLGIAEEYHAFDLDIITNINSVFLTLNQLGVGPKSPFQITDDKQTWTSFVNPEEVPGVQTYVYLKTRLLFDPPTNSFLVDSMQKQIAELEWRLNVQVDTEYPKESKESQTEEPPQIIPTPVSPVTPNPVQLVTMRTPTPTTTKPKRAPTGESVREAIAKLRASKSK